MSKSRILNKILLGVGLVTALSACGTGQYQMMRQNQADLDDAVVTAKVKDSLSKDPVLKKYAIDVTTISGEVILRGRVDSLEDVYRAARIVNEIEGVQFLFNDLAEKR